MKRKIDIAKDHISNLEHIIICPLCHHDLLISDNSLKCLNNHTYNLNKKGYIAFTDPINDKFYDREMFLARREVLESSIYNPVFEYIKSQIKENSLVLDAGSGEGTYLNKVYKPSNRHIGIDLAKEGINIATSYQKALWLLADLANLPVSDQSVDVILNILSPANYEQFNRVLKDDGVFIKVIVNEDYLKELREITDANKHNNQDVIELVERNFDIQTKNVIKYTTEVDKTLSQSLFRMTPLTKHHEMDREISEITIDLTIIVAKKKVNL